jgi:hypothetical protein
MKLNFITIISCTFLFAACSGKQTQEHDHNDGTHQHDENIEHHVHDVDTSKQEEFTVPSDTAIIENENEKTHTHTHDGNEHPHTH